MTKNLSHTRSNNMKLIPPYELKPLPLNDEATKLTPFKWASPEIGKRHKLGGVPREIERRFWPTCKECSEKMTFYGQLDSINDEFMIADCGIIEVYFCFDCIEVSAQVSGF